MMDYLTNEKHFAPMTSAIITIIIIIIIVSGLFNIISSSNASIEKRLIYKHTVHKIISKIKKFMYTCKIH